MYPGGVEASVQRRKSTVEGNESLNPFKEPINVLEEQELKKLAKVSSRGVVEWNAEDPRRKPKPTENTEK